MPIPLCSHRFRARNSATRRIGSIRLRLSNQTYTSEKQSTTRWFRRSAPATRMDLMKKLTALAPLALLALFAQTPVYDTVIRGGRVLDGDGNPWILADVAIR